MTDVSVDLASGEVKDERHADWPEPRGDLPDRSDQRPAGHVHARAGEDLDEPFEALDDNATIRIGRPELSLDLLEWHAGFRAHAVGQPESREGPP